MLKRERLVPIKEAASLLPSSNSGPPCYDTILSWTTKGLRGVVLETMWVGGRKQTSQQAIDRFLQAVAENRSPSVLPGTIDIAASDAARERLLRKFGGGAPRQESCIGMEIEDERRRQVHGS